MSGAPALEIPGSRTSFEALPGGGYAYVLLDENVRIELRYLRREHSHLHAEVDVRCTWSGVTHHRGSLSCADQNLSSLTARKTLAKHCADRAKTKPADFDWQAAIDAACLETIAAERLGADVVVLDDAPDVADCDIEVGGLRIPGDAASMLIAHGDSLKSMLMLHVLGTLAGEGRRVLYCDWEWTAERHRGRKRRLFGDDRLEGLRYLRCHAPLVVEVDRIRRYCDEHQIEFIGVDSVGLACDGKLSDDDVAIRFHRALGSLPPALCAAHVPKSSLSPEASKSDPIGPFGSVFFSNLCRMSWVVRKQPGASADVATIGCFPQKQNDGARLKPIGLEFDFRGASIRVRHVDLATVEGLSDRLPLQARIAGLLKGGALTYAEIADQLEAKVDTVVKATKRRPELFTVITASKDGIHRVGLTARGAA